MVFTVLLIIPALVALGFFLFSGRSITIKEFLVQIAVQAAIAGISTGIIYWSDTSDIETWNGVITSKKHFHVSCSHSYSCHCRQVCSGSGKNESCYTHCDTCYEHSYDVEWHGYTSNSEDIEINTVDRQGLHEPSRWTAMHVGEPTAIEHSYTNYIKAAPDTLFRRNGEYKQFQVPQHPRTYDYYRTMRIVTMGVPVPAVAEDQLNEVNAALGSRKQVNIMLMTVRNQPREWFYALEQRWLGGKKNDLTVVVSVDQQGVIQWVNVMAWCQNEMVKIVIRDSIMSVGKLQSIEDWGNVVGDIREGVTGFYIRKPMADFKYLESTITPTTTEWAISLVIGLLVAIGLGIVMIKNDLFNEETTYRR